MQANNAYQLKSKKDLIIFLHAAAFSPCISTWCQAIEKGFFATWPGLTSSLVRKYLPKPLATTKGHLKEERQGLRSTKATSSNQYHTPSPQPTDPKAAPTSIHQSLPHPQSAPTPTLIPLEPVDMTATAPKDAQARANYVHLARVDLSGMVATDLTGRSPTTSIEGNKYIMVLFSDDANGILAQPVKNRSEQELVTAIKKLQRIKRVNLPLRFHILDNECSSSLRTYLTNNNITYQLVPPYYHRQNPVERAIQIFKDHLVAGIASTNPQFPLDLWDKLLP
jgi:hypothetical protein